MTDSPEQPTVATLIARANEAREAAMEAGQYAAAVSAIKEMGVLSGLRIAKRDTRTSAVESMSDAELDALVRKLQDEDRETTH